MTAVASKTTSVSSLPNAEVAYRYACDVVLELMNCREVRPRHWQLDVHDGEGKKVFEIPFVELDPTLSHLRAEEWALVEHGSQVIRSFKDASAVPGGRSRPQGDPR